MKEENKVSKPKLNHDHEHGHHENNKPGNHGHAQRFSDIKRKGKDEERVSETFSRPFDCFYM